MVIEVSQEENDSKDELSLQFSDLARVLDNYPIAVIETVDFIKNYVELKNLPEELLKIKSNK